MNSFSWVIQENCFDWSSEQQTVALIKQHIVHAVPVGHSSRTRWEKCSLCYCQEAWLHWSLWQKAPADTQGQQCQGCKGVGARAIGQFALRPGHNSWVMWKNGDICCMSQGHQTLGENKMWFYFRIIGSTMSRITWSNGEWALQEDRQALRWPNRSQKRNTISPVLSNTWGQVMHHTTQWTFHEYFTGVIHRLW